MDSISTDWSVGSSEDQNVLASHDHHTGEQHAHLFTAGEHTHFFCPPLRKEHTTEETAHIGGILDLGNRSARIDDQKMYQNLCVIFRESRTGWS